MSRRAILATIVALLVGGAIGVWVGAGARRQPPPEVPRAAEPGPPVPEVLRGTGRIAVLVQTPRGGAVPDVLVRAVPRRDRPPVRDLSGRAPEDLPLADLVREFTAGTLRDRAERIEARTAEDGDCVLDGLADIAWQVTAYREGFHLEDEGSPYWMRPGGEVRFRAHPLVALRVTVLRPDGTEPDRARLDLDGSQNLRDPLWTPEQRVIWIPPGDHRLTVRAGRFREYVREHVPVSVRLEASPSPLVIRLKARLGIRGRVVPLPTDLRIPGEIRALRLAEGEGADTTRILDHRETEEVRAGRDHRFDVRRLGRASLAPGRWLVALVDGDEVLARAVVPVTDGIAMCELRVPEPDPWSHVIVAVIGPEGRRERGISVGSRVTVGGKTRSGPEGIPLRDGRYRVRHAVPGPDVAAGEASFALSLHRDFTFRATIPYPGPGTRELELPAPGAVPTSFDLLLTGYEGSGHEGRVTVTLESIARSAFTPVWFFDRPPNAEGRWFRQRIRPGEYELTVHARTSSSGCVTALRRTVTVESGENRLVLPLPPLHVLAVVCDDPGYRFSLAPVSDDGRERATAFRGLHEGRVAFEHLPAGEYAIQPSGPGRTGRVVIEVAGSREYRFDPSPVRGLTVSIQDREGRLARSGLLDGDLVVTVDGREVTTVERLRAVAAAATHERGSLLTVRTRSGWRDIRVDLSDPGSWGGDLVAGSSPEPEPTSYEITVDGVRPRLEPDEEPAPGKVFYLGGYQIALGAPGPYRFRTEGRTLLLETGPDLWTTVGVRVGKEKEGDEYVVRNPLAGMTPESIRELLSVEIAEPVAGLEEKLSSIDASRCVVELWLSEHDDWGSIPKLPGELRHLQLYLSYREGEGRSPPDLSPLRALKRLRWFRLGAKSIPFDLALLAANRQLRDLDLGKARVFHPECLAAFEELRTLRIEGSRLRDLTPLSGHRHLEFVAANGSMVERLPRGELPELRELDVMATEVSARDAAAFRAANPRCRLSHTWDEILAGKLAGVTRLRVLIGAARPAEGDRLLFEVADPAEVRRFIQGLTFDNHESGGFCMCGSGDIALVFFAGEEALGRIGVKHEYTRLLWPDVFPGEGELDEEGVEHLHAWLEERGFDAPRKAQTELERLFGADRRRDRRYEALLSPRVLRVIARNWSWDAEVLRSLAEEVPKAEARAALYLRLLGVDEGSWSLIYGLDREVLGVLLPSIERPVLLAAIRASLEDPRVVRGAGRWLLGERKFEAGDETNLTDVLPLIARTALASPRRSNRQRAMSTLARIDGPLARTLLAQVAAGRIRRRSLPEEDAIEPDDQTADWLDEQQETLESDRAYAVRMLESMGK